MSAAPTSPVLESKPEGLFVQPHSFKVPLEAGKDYWYCTCGKSKNQPFCDGSHKGTGLTPLKFSVQETKEYGLCGCRATANAPFCDGSHRKEAGLKKYNAFLLEKNAELKASLAASERHARFTMVAATSLVVVAVAGVVAYLRK